MLKNIPISLSGPVMNISLETLSFCILSNIGWLQQLNRRHGEAIFFTQQTSYRCIISNNIHYLLIIKFA